MAVRQRPPQDRSERALGLPLAARVKEVVGRPRPLLATVGPDYARERTAPEAHQQAKGLPCGAVPGAELGKDREPVPDDHEERVQEAHGGTPQRALGSRPKVFFAV